MTDRQLSREEIVEAMQMAWDDFVADTGCFPDCFTWRGGNGVLFANFNLGNYATFVTDWLNRSQEAPKP